MKQKEVETPATSLLSLQSSRLLAIMVIDEEGNEEKYFNLYKMKHKYNFQINNSLNIQMSFKLYLRNFHKTSQ